MIKLTPLTMNTLLGPKWCRAVAVLLEIADIPSEGVVSNDGSDETFTSRASNQSD